MMKKLMLEMVHHAHAGTARTRQDSLSIHIMRPYSYDASYSFCGYLRQKAGADTSRSSWKHHPHYRQSASINTLPQCQFNHAEGWMDRNQSAPFLLLLPLILFKKHSCSNQYRFIHLMSTSLWIDDSDIEEPTSVHCIILDMLSRCNQRDKTREHT